MILVDSIKAPVERAESAAAWEKLRFLSVVYQLDAFAERRDTGKLRQHIASRGTRRQRRGLTQARRGRAAEYPAAGGASVTRGRP